MGYDIPGHWSDVQLELRIDYWPPVILPLGVSKFKYIGGKKVLFIVLRFVKLFVMIHIIDLEFILLSCIYLQELRK